MTKALSKTEIEVNFHTTVKAIHEKPTANTTVVKDRKPACPEQGTMPTFATSSQHYMRSSSQSKQARKRKRKGIRIRKEEATLSLFTAVMTLYLRKPQRLHIQS